MKRIDGVWWVRVDGTWLRAGSLKAALNMLKCMVY